MHAHWSPSSKGENKNGNSRHQQKMKQRMRRDDCCIFLRIKAVLQWEQYQQDTEHCVSSVDSCSTQEYSDLLSMACWEHPTIPAVREMLHPSHLPIIWPSQCVPVVKVTQKNTKEFMCFYGVLVFHCGTKSNEQLPHLTLTFACLHLLNWIRPLAPATQGKTCG